MEASEFEFRHRFWLIAAVFSAGFACYSFDPHNAAVALSLGSRTGTRAILGLGALLILAAAALRTWAAAYLRTEVVKDGALHADRLVAEGPYRHLRNPLYLGTLVTAVGFGLMASRVGFVVIVGGVALVIWRLIGREEAELRRVQGDRFEDYRSSVPSLWPALAPRVPGGDLHPHWRQALAGEAMMWGFALAAAAFAVTRDPRLLYALVAVGFLGYFRRAQAGRA